MCCKISNEFCPLVRKFTSCSRPASSVVDFSSLFITFLHWFPMMVFSSQSISGTFMFQIPIWCPWGIYSDIDNGVRKSTCINIIIICGSVH